MDASTEHRTRRASGAAGRHGSRAGAAAIVVAGGLLASACSSGAPGAAAGGGPHGSPRDVLLASVQRTEALDSATVSLRLSVSGTPAFGLGGLGGTGTTQAPLSLTITGSGAFDFRHRTGQFSLTVPPTKTDPAGGTVEIRLLGSDLYLRAPKLSAAAGGKPWIHVDAGAYEQSQGKSSGPLSGFSDGDPTQVLDMLRQVSGTVTEVGTATIDGVPTTEYQGTLDLTRAEASTGSTSLGSAFGKAFGLTDIPIDVWVDGAGRARRIQTSFAILGVTVSAQEGLGGFGEAVHVVAPPAGQVADGSGLLGSGALKGLLNGSST